MHPHSAQQSRAPARAGSDRGRRGFTLIEMMVSMVILMAVTSIAVSLLQNQTRLFASQGGRTEAEQNARFAVTMLDRELRMAGAGVVGGQPMLVEAGPTSITFNADLVSRTLGDVGTVNVDPDADSNAVAVFRTANALLLPEGSMVYPETTYMKAAGVPSGAETVSYYLVRDSASADPNQYILYRRVNATAPQVVARNIVHTARDTVFQYFKADTTGSLLLIPPALLPLTHSAAIDGSPSDTGRFALIDSVRTVRVSFTTVYHDPRNGDVYRTVQTTIRILNSGLAHATTCGDPPLGVAPSASASPPGSPTPSVTVTWNASVDEQGGQKSVERYMVYRRTASAAGFSEAYATIPAGQTSYTYTDNNVQSGDSLVYGVSAQDCTPNNSPIGATGMVIVP